MLSLATLTVSAQPGPLPLWAQRGVAKLNNDRISKDYHFEAFNRQLTDSSIVITAPVPLLRMNMAENLGVAPESISIDSIMPAPGERTTYRLTFPSPRAEEEETVYVQRVDDYLRYDNNIDGSFTYDIRNLYAVSEPDITPVFDNFTVTRRYGALPLAMSLIPGMGQIYKGQAAKGYALLYSEIAMAALITYGDLYYRYYMKKAKKEPWVYGSWKSKANTFRAVRNIGIILGGAAYIYNLFDALLAKGAPRVVIKPASKNVSDISFLPMVFPNYFGAGITVNLK